MLWGNQGSLVERARELDLSQLMSDAILNRGL